MLDSLERDYKRDEDWLTLDKSATPDDRAAALSLQIQKHLEQKEAFLKVRFTAIFR